VERCLVFGHMTAYFYEVIGPGIPFPPSLLGVKFSSAAEYV
jgi:hypothetical protein